MSASSQVLSNIRSSFSRSSAPPKLVPPTPAPPSTAPSQLDDQLDTLSGILDHVEARRQVDDLSPVAQVVSQTMVNNLPDPLNPTQPRSTLKETVQTTTEAPQVDVSGGVQLVEHEPSPEIPPEVEAYVERVESSTDQLPQEITVAGDNIDSTPQHLPKKPVVVLPITPEIEKEAQFKGVHDSVKWLVEWSHKIMKMFSGSVIYRQE